MNKVCRVCKDCEIHARNELRSWLSDTDTMFSVVNLRPNSKLHTVALAKRHVEDLRKLTSQEWNDLLLVIQDSIKKIEKLYSPVGYRISIPIGEKANQNEPFHFYCRVVPKYKKNWGTTAMSLEMKYKPLPAFTEAKEKLKQALQPNQERVIAEKSKVVAKLVDEEEVVTFTREKLTGAIAIFTKSHSPNDIQAMDEETWAEIGQMLKELMKKMEDQDVCHDFQPEFILGKEALMLFKEEAKVSSNNAYPDSEFVVLLVPRYKSNKWWKEENRPIKDGKTLSTMEHERLAEKLRDPEAYAQEWVKKSAQVQEEQKPESLKQQIARLQEENQKLKQELEAVSKMSAVIQQTYLPPK